MITLEGKYGEAKILQNSEYVETKAIEQLKNILNSPVVENQNIVVMPDVHLGKGPVIGYTQTLKPIPH